MMIATMFHSPEIDGKGMNYDHRKDVEELTQVSKKITMSILFLIQMIKISLYIGKSKSIRTRLRNHLICCAKSTSSKFKKLKNILKAQKKSSFTIIHLKYPIQNIMGQLKGR
jgi:hypothetical protein